MIEIERHVNHVEADEYRGSIGYDEIRLRLRNPHKSYEVSLMKNTWEPGVADRYDNYREVATIDKNNDDYIQDGQRWDINVNGKEILKVCLAAYSYFDDHHEFHEYIYGKKVA